MNNIFRNDAGNDPVTVYLVSSVCGGTGSGLLLQLSFLLKNYIQTTFSRNAQIKALLIFPGIYTSSNDIELTNDERNRLRSNGYAFFKEWHTYNDIYVNGTNNEQAKELLTLPIGQLGALAALTPATLTQGSDVLDPINYFVCIDFSSISGHTLLYSDYYKRMTEDYLFLDIATYLGTNAESRIDNAMSALVAENGLSRFVGFGSSKLEYPINDLIELSAAQRIKDTLHNYWLEIDTEYYRELQKVAEKRKKGINVQRPEIRDFFVNLFDQFVDQGRNQNFYKNKKELIIHTDEDDHGNKLDSIGFDELFIKHMEAHLDHEIKSIIHKKSGQNLQKYYASEIERALSSLTRTSENIDRLIMDIEQSKRAYKNEAELISEAYYSGLCGQFINMDDESMIQTQRDKEYNLSHYILGIQDLTKTQEGSALHPLLVRYLLYKIFNQLNRKIESLKKVRIVSGKEKEEGHLINGKSRLDERSNYDYYDETPDCDKIDAAIGLSKSADTRFSMFKIFSKSRVQEILETYKENVSEEVQLLSKYHEYNIKYNVYNRLLKRTALLIEYWESFFNSVKMILDDPNNDINQKIKTLKDKKQSESILGIQKLFDDPELRDRFINKQFENYSNESFESDITEILFVTALSKFSKFPDKINDKEEILKADFIAILFSELRKTIEKSRIFEINIVKALMEEATLSGLKDVKSHITNKLEFVGRKAGPFINPSINTQGNLRTIDCWGMHPETLKKLSEIYTAGETQQLFGAVNIIARGTATTVDGSFYTESIEISEYEIIRSNQNFNFGLSNILNFQSPNEQGKEISLDTIFCLGGET